MEYWAKVTILLCTYGFFLYIKPSEPFLTPYLMGPVHNLTEEQVVNEIYPVWIYSYLALLLPVFLLTDYLRYKPIIILQGLGHIGCWTLLLFGRGVYLMQLMQVCYAIATAGEIGYYSYIYSIVDESQYQFVTSCVRSTTLVGYFIGSLLSQLLVSLAHLDYFWLNVISLVNVSIAFFISWFLPMPRTSLFFYAAVDTKAVPEDGGSSTIEDGSEEKIGDAVATTDNNDDPAAPVVESSQQHNSNSMKSTLISLWTDVINSYRNANLLRWSLWWAFSTCGWLLVVNYIQNLWESILSSSEHNVYNGAVESIATVLGAIGAFSVGYLKLNWSKWGELALGIFSLIKCGFLLIMYLTTNIWICYVVYVGFIFLYNVVITITQFQIAIGLNTQRFALVFGVNTFAAVALNTLLTIVLIDKVGLGLDVETQFVVYSGYFGLVALIFLSHAVYSFVQQCRVTVVKTSL